MGQKDIYFNEKEYAKQFKLSNGYFLAGKKLFKKGNIEKAEKKMVKCLSIFQKHDQAHFYLSIILYNRGEYLKAAEHIREAENNFDLKNIIHENLHIDYLENLRTQRDDVIRLKQTVESQEMRDKLEARIRLINFKLSNSKYKKEKMPAGYPYYHGNILLKLKRYREAHDKYLEALKINPNHGKACNNLATLYFMVKKYREALDYLEKAEKNGAKINPEFKKTILQALNK